MPIRDKMRTMLEARGKKIWQMSFSEYAAQHGDKGFQIATVSPMQTAMASKAQKNRWAKERYAKSAERQKLRKQYEKEVLKAYKKGEFNYKRSNRTSGLHDDASSVATRYEIDKDKKAEKEAKAKAAKAANPKLAHDDVEKGDKVYFIDRDAGEGWGVITRVFKSQVQLKLDDGSKIKLSTYPRMGTHNSPLYSRKPK